MPAVSHPLPIASIKTLAASIFSDARPTVTEMYSSFDCPLERFQAADESVAAAARAAKCSNGALHLAVHFPDTGGAVLARRIPLDPARCGGATFRYSCDGSGIISVVIAVGPAAPWGQPRRFLRMFAQIHDVASHFGPIHIPNSAIQPIGTGRLCRDTCDDFVPPFGGEHKLRPERQG